MWKIFILIIVMIVFYWFLLLSVNGNEERSVYADPLNKIVFEAPFLERCCSWWPISHFILFTVIGFLFPECDVMAILAGIGWELAEVGVYYGIGQNRQGVRKGNTNKIEYGTWWAGSTKDIVMNIAGFYTGKLFATMYGKDTCVQELENCDEHKNIK